MVLPRKRRFCATDLRVIKPRESLTRPRRTRALDAVCWCSQDTPFILKDLGGPLILCQGEKGGGEGSGEGVEFATSQ